MLKNQNGYALLNVLLVFTILTIGGVSLLGITMSSQKFVAYSQTYTEDMAAAEMELDEGIANLQIKLDALNNNIMRGAVNSINLHTAIAEIIQTLNLNQEENSANYLATPIRNITDENNIFIQKVEISVPIQNRKSKILKKTITISTLADVFKYSAVSDGKLTLNGATDIIGDINVKDAIYLSNHAKFLYNSKNYRPETTFPSINGNLSVEDDGSYSQKFFTGVDPNWTPIQNLSNINNYFVHSPSMKNRDVNTNQFDIKELVNEKVKMFSNVSLTNLFESDSSEVDTKTYSKGVIFSNHLKVKNSLTVNGNLILNRGITLLEGAKLKVTGNIFIYSPFYSFLSGNIELTNKNNFLLNFGYSYLHNLDLKGKMYNYGSLDVRDDLNMNGTIYVSGNTTIENLNNRSGGTAVILSDGNLQVSNNNQYQTSPKEMNAFLYSNQDLEIYGVGSNIKIKGGIYGKNIILNATKGNTYPVRGYSDYISNLNTSNYNTYGNYLYIEKNQSNPSLQSRLKIEFNPDIILNPPTGIPTVEKLQITEIDQKIE
ncbi:hypothetical protein H4O14_06085 [Bacillus sp. PAMC26568]|nr:hypothetical protein H4O14_06085 [Bacillus sp. PAMC26568]